MSSALANATTPNVSFNDTTAFCGLMTPDFLQTKLVLISIVGSCIGAFGIFGNICAVLIFSRPEMRSPNNFFLTTLAAFDTLLLITAFCIYAIEYIVAHTGSLHFHMVWLSYLRFMFTLGHIAQTGSVYTTVAVTLERFLAIVHPTMSRTCCSNMGALISIIIVCAFAILFNATRFFEIEIERNPLCDDGDFQRFMASPGVLAKNSLYTDVYTLWLTNVVMVFFPFLCLLVFNLLIAISIRHHVPQSPYSRGHKAMKELSRETTVILIVVVTIFLVCNLWGFVLALLEKIVGPEELVLKYPVLYTFSREIINFLAMVNASINFVIYCIFGQEFRRHLLNFTVCKMHHVPIFLPENDKFAPWRNTSRRRAVRECGGQPQRKLSLDYDLDLTRNADNSYLRVPKTETDLTDLYLCQSPSESEQIQNADFCVPILIAKQPKDNAIEIYLETGGSELL